jgi:ElaB/YqjD/DUF883 family membrane-anchored ribosome-binding protein
MTRRQSTGAPLSEQLARAEADVEQARERVSSSVQALRDQIARPRGRSVSSWSDTVTGYIKDRPGRCLLGALALGFVIGKLARRA